MQAIHENYTDNPSSSITRERQHEDMKGAQFVVQSNLKSDFFWVLAGLFIYFSFSYVKIHRSAEQNLWRRVNWGFRRRGESKVKFRLKNYFFVFFQLFFKTVNRSKFCVFRFAPEFFNACDVSMINKKAVNICRLSMKVGRNLRNFGKNLIFFQSAQRIFKGVAFGEKNFVGCEFRIDPKAERMMVKLQMNYGKKISCRIFEKLAEFSDIERTIHAKLREMGSMLHKPTYNRSGCRNITVVFASLVKKNEKSRKKFWKIWKNSKIADFSNLKSEFIGENSKNRVKNQKSQKKTFLLSNT